MSDVVAYGTPRGRAVLAATVLGSSMAFLDGTVVNVALPAIGRDLHASIAGLQWTINGYTLPLAALILLGGSLGDHFGRRRVFLVGVVWFATASLVCAIAPNLLVLVLARALQGVGGALLTPGSLAIIQATFRPDDRPRAIGAWTGLGGIAGAIGPFVGGGLVLTVGWRWVFLVNLPVGVAIVLVALRWVPESRDADAARGIDVPGAVLATLGLGGLTFGLIAWPGLGPGSPAVWAPLVGGVVALGLFVLAEARSAHPMLPLEVFSNRLFTATNVVTFAVYAALSGVFFVLVVALQVVAGFSPIAAGAALLPVTIIMFFLAARGGALGQRIGARIPMTLGPLVSAAGVLSMTRIVPAESFVTGVLPGTVLLGLGLSLTVAPLTATVLGAVEVRHAGIASGVNNAVARAAGLLAVAAVPLVAGITPAVYENPARFGQAAGRALLACAVLLAVGGLLSWLMVRAPRPAPPPSPLRPVPVFRPVSPFPPSDPCPPASASRGVRDPAASASGAADRGGADG